MLRALSRSLRAIWRSIWAWVTTSSSCCREGELGVTLALRSAMALSRLAWARSTRSCRVSRSSGRGRCVTPCPAPPSSTWERRVLAWSRVAWATATSSGRGGRGVAQVVQPGPGGDEGGLGGPDVLRTPGGLHLGQAVAGGVQLRLGGEDVFQAPAALGQLEAGAGGGDGRLGGADVLRASRRPPPGPGAPAPSPAGPRRRRRPPAWPRRGRWPGGTAPRRRWPGRWRRWPWPGPPGRRWWCGRARRSARRP